MSCKHCLWGIPIETKEKFKYETTINFDTLIVRENTIFGKKPLYCLTINYCPMCGDKTIKSNFCYEEYENIDESLKNFYIENFGEKWFEDKIKNYKKFD